MNDTQMDFGQALHHLKLGDRVARAGWNGKGMFLFLVPAGTIEHPAVGASVSGPYIAINPVGGVVIPWLASQADILAEDWEVLP